MTWDKVFGDYPAIKRWSKKRGWTIKTLVVLSVTYFMEYIEKREKEIETE